MVGMATVRVHEWVDDPELNIRGYALIMLLGTARKDWVRFVQTARCPAQLFFLPASLEPRPCCTGVP